MHPYHPLSLLAAVALACGPCAAFAADDPATTAPPLVAPAMAPVPPPATPVAATAQAHPEAASIPVLAGSTPVDIERLAAMRGGDDTIESSTTVDGSVHDNTADHVVSGSNFISDGAFSDASGLNTVIQNSGSNVLIQNGMSIQVIFANPGP